LGIFNNSVILEAKDSNWRSMQALMSCFMSSILASMVECMEELMVNILALICLISSWVVEISDDRELRQFSSSWLWVWAMVKGKHMNAMGGSTLKMGYR
jgi:hypothetical protein